MKTFKKALILIVAIVCVAATVALAACDKDKNKAQSFTLTLDAGEGTCAATTLTVAEGAKLQDALAQYPATSANGLTFVGWQLNGALIDENTVMPSADATVVALYKASYTIKYFLQNRDAQYVEAVDKRETRYGDLGERVYAFDSAAPTISGYTYNPSHPDSVTRIDSLSTIARYNEMRMYYALNGNHLIFHDNAPAGTVATGTMQEGIYDESQTVTAPQCGFDILGCRFLGWATAEGTDTIAYNVGDTVQFGAGGTVELYAVWLRGKADAIGGGDYLYIYADRPNKIYLSRQGLEEKEGQYNQTTGVFTFTDDLGGVLLRGVVDGDYFYYYNDNVLGTYSAIDGDETLTITDEYAATFTDANGAQHTGVVSFDTDWNYYVFEGNDDYLVRFVFRTEGDTTYLFLQNMEEAGFYATEDGFPVIYLDGLGNFTYYYDPDNTTYRDYYTQEKIYITYGVYTRNALGYFECNMYTGSNIATSNLLETFLFRVTDQPATKVSGNNENFGTPAPFSASDIKDNAIERSSFYGQLSDDLYLDGFGGGTYHDEQGDHEGTYTVVHDFWLTEDGQNADHTWVINFNFKQNATKDIYFALRQDRYNVVRAQLFGIVDKNEKFGGLYFFADGIVIGGNSYAKDEAFLMGILGEDKIDSMLLVKVDQQPLQSGEMVYLFAAMYTDGEVTYVEDGDYYHFVDITGDNELNFKVNEEGKLVYLKNVGEGGIVTIAPGLEVNRTTSRATYTDANGTTYNDVEFNYSLSQFVEFYTFFVSDDLTLYYYRDIQDGGEPDFVKITGDRLFDYAYETEDLFNPYPARLMLATDSNKAYIAVPINSSMVDFVGVGTYQELPNSQNNEYIYHNRHWVDSLLDYFGGDGFTAARDEFIDDYDDFTFRAEVEDENTVGKFYERYDDFYFDLDNFKASGYNINATYTDDGGTQYQGTFIRMEMIIVFSVADSDKSFYLRAEGNRMKNVSDDAGLYYLYQPDDVWFMTFGPESGGYSYLVYDGENQVSVVSIENDYLENNKPGTMVKSANWSEDFREYTLTVDNVVYNVLLGTMMNLYEDTYLIYDVYNEAYTGHWYTDDGDLIGDGYQLHSATYDEDGDGEVDYTGLLARATFDKKDTQYHAYTVDPNGDVLVFTYELEDGTTASKVFNIDGAPFITERKLIFGSFNYWNEGTRYNRYMYLDGAGNAELYSESDMRIRYGTYRLAPEISEESYQYIDSQDSSQNFYFAITIEQGGEGTYFEYRMGNQEFAGDYEADDWSLLHVGVFGDITYIDRYGTVYEGYYRVNRDSTLTLVTYDGSGREFRFRCYNGTGYFELM